MASPAPEFWSTTFIDGGLVILSKYAVIAKDIHRYQHCGPTDGMAAKVRSRSAILLGHSKFVSPNDSVLACKREHVMLNMAIQLDHMIFIWRDGVLVSHLRVHKCEDIYDDFDSERF